MRRPAKAVREEHESAVPVRRDVDRVPAALVGAAAADGRFVRRRRRDMGAARESEQKHGRQREALRQPHEATLLSLCGSVRTAGGSPADADPLPENTRGATILVTMSPIADIV